MSSTSNHDDVNIFYHMDDAPPTNVDVPDNGGDLPCPPTHIHTPEGDIPIDTVYMDSQTAADALHAKDPSGDVLAGLQYHPEPPIVGPDGSIQPPLAPLSDLVK